MDVNHATMETRNFIDIVVHEPDSLFFNKDFVKKFALFPCGRDFNYLHVLQPTTILIRLIIPSD